MPINRENKLAYVHIPRTGGTFVEHRIGVHQKRPDSGLGAKYYDTDLEHLFGGDLQHLSFEDLVMLLRRESKNFRWFSIVRHPDDRFLSVVRYTLRASSALTSYSTLLSCLGGIVKRLMQYRVRALFGAITGTHARKQIAILPPKVQHLMPQYCYLRCSGLVRRSWIPPIEIYPFTALNELPFMVPDTTAVGSNQHDKPNASRDSRSPNFGNLIILKLVARCLYRKDYRLYRDAEKAWKQSGKPLIRGSK